MSSLDGDGVSLYPFRELVLGVDEDDLKVGALCPGLILMVYGECKDRHFGCEVLEVLSDGLVRGASLIIGCACVVLRS